MKKCGLSFRNPTKGVESDLVESFIAGLRRTLPDRDYALFVEPKMPTGYPDCVLVEYDPRNYSRWTRRRHALSDDEMRVLSLLHPQRGLRVSSLVRKTGLSDRRVRRILDSLVENGDVICSEAGFYQAVNAGLRGVRSILSVEAKVRDFERVVDQAAVNRTFSNESYVLMPQRTLSPDRRAALRASRVGMLSVSRDGRLKRVQASARKRRVSSHLALYFNEWIGWKLLQEGESHVE